jgi:hypothetical protein
MGVGVGVLKLWLLGGGGGRAGAMSGCVGVRVVSAVSGCVGVRVAPALTAAAVHIGRGAGACGLQSGCCHVAAIGSCVFGWLSG